MERSMMHEPFFGRPISGAPNPVVDVDGRFVGRNINDGIFNDRLSGSALAVPIVEA